MKPFHNTQLAMSDIGVEAGLKRFIHDNMYTHILDIR